MYIYIYTHTHIHIHQVMPVKVSPTNKVESGTYASSDPLSKQGKGNYVYVHNIQYKHQSE